jgi:hypothetical protein
MKDYIVQRPTRGIQIFCVQAESIAEAKRLVDTNNIAVEPVDHEIVWSGKANKVIEDKAN